MRGNQKRCLVGALCILISCQQKQDRKRVNDYEPVKPLFVQVSTKTSTIHFSNDIGDLREYTPFNTLYIYNGGGVAAGDLDNDGLPDLVFTSNQNESKIYRNQGNFKFSDKTQQSGFKPKHPWVTGISLADVDQDGWLDIYVCRAGNEKTLDRTNELYINNHDFTFTEKAEEYGLDEGGASTQAYFFDYDNDEDLDVFIVSHPAEFNRAVEFHYYQNFVKDERNRDKLFRNDGGRFTDVTQAAGLVGDNGFGLSAAIIDVNHDGYDDIFVANDFFAPDRLFINQKNGTFKDRADNYFQKMSLFSMGSDQADYDLDGDYDLLVADMAPASMKGMKTHMFDLPLDWYLTNERFFNVEQVTRNMLYSRTLDEYADVAQMEDVARTDWSWSVFMEDLCNREYPDVLITNGLKRDFHDNDYSRKNFDDRDYHLFEGVPDALKLIEKMPQRTRENFFFVRDSTGKYTASNKLFANNNWNSQGAAIADLDGDGDLDVVFNNTDTVAAIYQNLTERDSVQSNHFRLKLTSEKNTFCVGCEAKVYYQGHVKQKRLFPVRGFQSTSESVLHFGLPAGVEAIDSLVITWPSRESSTHTNIQANQLTVIQQPENCRPWIGSPKLPQQVAIQLKKFKGLRHTDSGKKHVDFYQDKLNPFDLSSDAPTTCVADFDGDGLQDVLVGSRFQEKAVLFFQKPNAAFQRAFPFEQDSLFQESQLLAVDIDNDGDQDIYAASGGNMYPENDQHYQDRLYLNDGTGYFEYCDDCLPEMHVPTGTVSFHDLNKDGFVDAFVGGRHVPHHYGQFPQSHILTNHGGKLSESGKPLSLGMLTDSEWIDIDNDNDQDLIVVGEWISPIALLNENGKMELKEDYFGKDFSGFWRSIAAEDWNGDGMTDLVLGNYGLNTILKANAEEPITLYGGDFDNSGSYEPLVTHYVSGEEGFYTFRSEFCLKMPKFNGVFRTNKEYAESNIESVMKQGGKLEFSRTVKETRSGVLLRSSSGFRFEPLQHHLQSAPINDFLTVNDQMVLIAGNTVSNFYRDGSTIAMPLTLMLRTDKGMVVVPDKYSELRKLLVVKDLNQINIAGDECIVFLPANDSLVTVKVRQMLQ